MKKRNQRKRRLVALRNLKRIFNPDNRQLEEIKKLEARTQ